MLVRRWAHELTFMILRRCIATADREALRSDLNEAHTVAGRFIFFWRLAVLEYSAWRHLTLYFEFSEGESAQQPNCAA